MQNKWEKEARSTKMKAFTIAVLIHTVFFTALVAYSASGSEGGVFGWIKQKMNQDQTEQVVVSDEPRS